MVNAWGYPEWGWLDIDLSAADWGILLTAVGTLASAAILAATVLVARGALKDAQRTRHGQLITELSDRWGEALSLETIRIYGKLGNRGIKELVERIYGGEAEATNEDLEAFWKLSALPDLIETIGVLESEEVISARVIHKTWGAQIIEYWNAWNDAITEVRKHDEQDVAASYTYFQHLALKMRKLDEEG